MLRIIFVRVKKKNLFKFIQEQEQQHEKLNLNKIKLLLTQITLYRFKF